MTDDELTNLPIQELKHLVETKVGGTQWQDKYRAELDRRITNEAIQDKKEKKDNRQLSILGFIFLALTLIITILMFFRCI